jgi:hypothetical protein
VGLAARRRPHEPGVSLRADAGAGG